MACKICDAVNSDTWYTVVVTDRFAGVSASMFCSSECMGMMM